MEEDFYRIAAEHTSDTIVVVDHQSVVRFVSPSIRALSGYEVHQYQGTDAFGILEPEDRGRVRSLLAETVAAKQPVDLEYRVRHALGHTVHVEARVKPVLDEDGGVRIVVAAVRDVTQRKTAEELLQKILDNVNAAVWATDKDFSRYLYCSDSMEKISGMPRSEIMSAPIRMHDHIHPEDNEALMGEVKSRLDEGKPVSRAIRWIHHADEIRWGQLLVHPHLGPGGEVERLDGVMLDITDKKRAELALEESEQRYKSLFENNLDGVFSIELGGFYFVNANRAFEDLAGIRLNTLTDRCFIGLIHDEDHGAIYETLFEVMRHGEPREVECRLARFERGERIVSITFVPIFLAGQLNGIHGILKDITKRKQDERELIRSEERSKFLQQSLNRFANDLANVMKVSALESRLLEEVRAALPVTDATVVEVRGGEEESLLLGYDRKMKIGERTHPIYLCISAGRPLEKMEEEWLETSVQYARILYDNLHRTEDLMRRLEQLVSTNDTPRWMLRLLFKLSEKERASLSADLHDSVLQDLIIWYRKLESLRSAGSFEPETQRELGSVEEGLLDAIHQIRITCNELRPPFLLKLGLVESLKSLFSYARMFSNYEIEFTADAMPDPLNEEQILGVYRIVQELLNNANKHAQASKVTMSLADEGDHFRFIYSDDGIGIDLSAFEGSFRHMGLAGIEKRVQSLEGEVEFRSAPKQGFHVGVRLPKTAMER